MKNILLFGAPGAGKGTQSKKIILKYGLVHLSTGDILRSEIARNTELGKEARTYMVKGELVPDNIVIEMIEQKIKNQSNSKGFVFDGFPRTVAQAKSLDDLLNKNNTEISFLLALLVETDELKKRMQIRASKENRTDDTPDVIENRIKVYKEKTAPVADYYKKQNKYITVSGMGSVEEIFAGVSKVIDKIFI